MPARVPGSVNWRRLALFLTAAAAFMLLAGIASNIEDIELSSPPQLFPGAASGGEAAVDDFVPVLPEDGSPITRREALVTGWMAIVVGVILGVGALWFLSKNRIKIMVSRRRSFKNNPVPTPAHLPEKQHAEAIIEFAESMIGDLRSGGDAGEAIQRCYAAVETGFGRRELRRRPAETPLAYLDRIFGRNKQAAEPLRTLTNLFQIARFSQEPVTESMRTTAIDALVAIRDSYASIGRKRARVS